MARGPFVFLILALVAGCVGWREIGTAAAAAWLLMAASLFAMLIALLITRGRLSRT